MLGKQWLNQYEWTDIRGAAIERSQNRQRKLDGITAWYFGRMMEALPLMLQIALLLLGCALSRYLWEINIVVASVVLGVTVFGVAFYVFIVIAGAASESCPYQTPGAHILRHIFRCILQHMPPALASSWCCNVPVRWWSLFERPWYSTKNILPPLVLLPFMLMAAAADAYLLGRAILRSLVAFGRMAYRWVTGPQTRTLDQPTTVLGLRCVSWMLRTSLDKTVRLSALKHLTTMMTLAEFNPCIVADCFDVFVGSINVGDHKLAIMHESEQLATVSAMCFLRTFHRLSIMDPTSSVLEDVRRRYRWLLFSPPCFWDLPLCYVMDKIEKLVYPTRDIHFVQPPDYVPFTQEHIPVARAMAEGAQVEYQQAEHRKVPRWILRFALHSLSLDPLPPTSVIADCLSIIAIDLGCDTRGAGFTTSDERCVHILRTTATLISNQYTSGANFETNNPESQHDGRS